MTHHPTRRHLLLGAGTLAAGLAAPALTRAQESPRNLSGFVLMYTGNVVLGRNTIVDHRSAGTGLGIVIKDVRGIRIEENVVVGNRTGLQAEGVVHDPDAPALVMANRLAANDVGVALMATADLMFGGNVFDANLTQVLALEPGVERRNLWAYRGAGNAWSDYRGFDLAADGLGDVPYRSGGADQVVLAAAPGLQAYRAAPAYGVLEAAQDVWAAGRPPVVLDAWPLTVDPLPPAAAGPVADGPLGWMAAGVTLAAASIAAWAWAAGRSIGARSAHGAPGGRGR